MVTKYPKTFKALQEELLIHAQDGRRDAGFRLAIFMSQLGPMASHFTHDPIENPIARPYGSPMGEVHDFGHALVQLMTYGALRGLDLEQAINLALDNLRGKDFMRCEAKDDNMKGTVASVPINGSVVVQARVLKIENLNNPLPLLELDVARNVVLVTGHPSSAHTHKLHQFRYIITANGSMTCHAAIVARESGLGCIVGVANAMDQLTTGDVVTMDFETGEVRKVE